MGAAAGVAGASASGMDPAGAAGGNASGNGRVGGSGAGSTEAEPGWSRAAGWQLRAGRTGCGCRRPRSGGIRWRRSGVATGAGRRWQSLDRKLCQWGQHSLGETLGFPAFPLKLPGLQRSARMMERRQKKIRRRTPAVRIFPNAAGSGAGHGEPRKLDRGSMGFPAGAREEPNPAGEASCVMRSCSGLRLSGLRQLSTTENHGPIPLVQNHRRQFRASRFSARADSGARRSEPGSLSKRSPVMMMLG